MSLLWLWSSWSILIGFTLPRENRGSHSHQCFGLLVLASSFTISTHPLPSSLVFNPTDFLTYGMEELFPPLELLLDKAPCLYCVSALSWWQNLPLVSWIVCLNHFDRFSRCLALCKTPLGHLRCCWLKVKAHILPVLEMLYMRPWKMKMIKLCFLTYVKKGKTQWNAKIPLEGYKKRSKKAMVKNMLYPNIANIIK